MPRVTATVPDQRLFWDRWHDRHLVASHTDHSEAALSTFVGALVNQPGCHVLEIGCGQGREAVSLARQGFRVSAFDRSHVAIATARSNALRAGLKVAFSEQDAALPLPYTSRTFGGVFSHLSLHYFDDRTTRRLFDEIARVLEFQGVLFFTVRSVRDPLYGQGEPMGENMFCLKGHVRHFFDDNYVRDVLQEGWNIKLAEYYGTSDRTVNPGAFLRVLAVRPEHFPASS